MKLFYKLSIVTILTLVGMLFYLYKWQAPQIRKELLLSPTKLYEYIQNHPQGKHQTIQSMNHSFDISYIENMPLESYNPYFPSIYIANNDSYTGWLQVVTTDNTIQPKYQHFIDSFPKGYPFYTTSESFQDAPQWNYSFFIKPLSFWKAHTYAVQLDNNDKTIKCLGGISWGYKLPQFSFKPSMILPEPLSKQDWQKDWKEMYKPIFKDYRDIT